VTLNVLLRPLLQKSLKKSMIERVHNILHQHLGTKKSSVRWVPWVTSGESAPKKMKTVPSAGKATVFEKQLAHKKVLFHHDNAPTHSFAVVAKLMELRFQLVSHPLYSPDLASSDYYLFPNLKKWLAGRRFYSNQEDCRNECLFYTI
ncbi:MOS1T transposase, partial [Pseudoatta argentina]